MTPLREGTAGATPVTAHLFPPRPTARPWQNWSVDLFRGPGKTHKNYMMALGTGLTFYEDRTPDGERVRRFLDAGENPPTGVIVYYLLPGTPAGPATLTVLDAAGRAIRTFGTRPEPPPAAEGGTNGALQAVSKEERYVTARPGLNRFVWDLRYPGAEKVPGDVTTEKAITGPLAPPGVYQVRLTVGDQSWTQSFELKKDPRVPVGQADLDAQFALWSRIRDTLSETHAGINRLRRIRRQLGEWSQKIRESTGAGGDGRATPPGETAEAGGRVQAVAEAALALGARLTAIESELIQTGAQTSVDTLRLPARLNLRLVSLISVVSSADAAPPRQAFDVYEHLATRVRQELDRLQALVETDVAAFNALVRDAGLPAITIH